MSCHSHYHRGGSHDQSRETEVSTSSSLKGMAAPGMPAGPTSRASFDDGPPPPPPPGPPPPEEKLQVKSPAVDAKQPSSSGPAASPAPATEAPQLPPKRLHAAAATPRQKSNERKQNDAPRDPKKDIDPNLYAKNLKAHFPRVNEQIKSGLFVLKRMAGFLKKVIQVQDQYAISLIQVTENEKAKYDEVTKDEMSDHSNAVLDLRTVMETSAKKMRNFTVIMQKSAIDPLLKFYDTGEARRQALERSERKYAAQAEQLVQELSTGRQLCMKEWQKLTDERAKLLRKKKPLDSLKGMAEKVAQAFARFESERDRIMGSINEYQQVALPNLLQDMQALEVERLKVLSAALKLFSEQCAEAGRSTDLDKHLKATQNLNVAYDIENWVEGIVEEYGATDVCAPESTLPCLSTEVMDQTVNKPGGKTNLSMDITDDRLDTDDDSRSGDAKASSRTASPSNARAPASSSAAEVKEWVKAKFNFASGDADDLPFKAGDIIGVITKDLVPASPAEAREAEREQSRWWMGQLRAEDGSVRSGLFPSNYVEDCSEVVNKRIADDRAAGKTVLLPWQISHTRRPSTDDDAKSPLKDELAEEDDEDDDDDDAGLGGGLTGVLRRAVSKQKKRFQKDGFDLDLTYITDNIIAMGFPSESFEGMYRNPMSEVQRFFTKRHPACCKVYNLCAEPSHQYSADKFEGRVACFPFDDHNPPPFSMCKAFCEDVDKWLKADPKHVVAVHCKAGKGRTGTMISMYLLYTKQFPTADAALQFFDVQRTKNAKGVTIPSQIRWVHYFEQAMKREWSGEPPFPEINPIQLTNVHLYSLPHDLQQVNSKFKFWFEVKSGDYYYSSKSTLTPERRPAQDYVFFSSLKRVVKPVWEETCICFYKKSMAQTKMFEVWLLPRFHLIDPKTRVLKLEFPKSEIDKARKDYKHLIYSTSLKVVLEFEPGKIKKTDPRASMQPSLGALLPQKSAKIPSVSGASPPGSPGNLKSPTRLSPSNRPLLSRKELCEWHAWHASKQSASLTDQQPVSAGRVAGCLPFTAE